MSPTRTRFTVTPARAMGVLVAAGLVAVPAVAVASGGSTGGHRAASSTSTVSVSSGAGLQDALRSAAPGETIALAAGSYGGQFTISQSGTVGAPITITGPPTAVLDGGETKSGYTLHLLGASYVTLTGFSVVGGQKGIVLDSSDHDVLSGLDVSGTGDEAVHFRTNSSSDTIEHSTVHHTGLHSAVFGEGIYFGSAQHNWPGGQPDRSDYDQAIDNTVYDTTAENIDTKEGTTGGLVEGNHLDGAGSSAADAWVDVKGNGYTVTGNTGVHAGAGPDVAGAETFVLAPGYGNHNVFSDNHWDFAPGTGRYGFEIDGGTGNLVGCSNTVIGATALANIACSGSVPPPTPPTTAPPGTTPPTTTPPTTAPPGTTPPGTTPPGTTPPGGAGTIGASWTLSSSWPGGYVAHIVVSAEGGSVPAWGVSWADPAATSIVDAWGMTCGVAGGRITCQSAGWGAPVKPGDSEEVGLQVATTGPAPADPALQTTG